MYLIPVYLYTYNKPSRCIIKLYDIVEREENRDVYYTVCLMIGNDGPVIVRLLTDIIANASTVGNIESSTAANLIRTSFRRDNKWQREETQRINDIATYYNEL